MTLDELVSEIESDAFVRYCSASYDDAYWAFHHDVMERFGGSPSPAVGRALDRAFARACAWRDAIQHLPV